MKKKFDQIESNTQLQAKQDGAVNFSKTAFKTLLLSATMCMTSVAIASPVNVNSTAPDVYVVQKGDTLWNIAGLFLKKPWLWPQIWVKNSQIKNPNLIYPNDRILVCKNNQSTFIGKDEGDGCNGVVSRANENLKSVELLPRVRVQSLQEAIPIIPLKNIQVWLNRSLILPSTSLKNTPVVIGADNARLLSGAGQKVYISGNNLTIGMRYGVYKQMQPYLLTNQNGNTYNAGTELLQVASGIVTHIQNDGVATLELIKNYNEEVRKNDFVLPEQSSDLPDTFTPTPATLDSAKIIRVANSISSAAKHNIVTIDKGSNQGVDVGQVFDIKQTSLTKRDLPENIKHLPYEKVGQLMVFKTFSQLSYAYILESSVPIQLNSMVHAPE